MDKKEIAHAFSMGNFEVTFPFLASDVVWNVVEEESVSGVDSVLQECQHVQNYFKEMETKFETQRIIQDGNVVVVTGTGEFKKDGIVTSFISASDVYEFNVQDKLIKIDSYCIQRKLN